MYGPRRINSHDSCDPLTFLLAPHWGWFRNVSKIDVLQWNLVWPDTFRTSITLSFVLHLLAAKHPQLKWQWETQHCSRATSTNVDWVLLLYTETNQYSSKLHMMRHQDGNITSRANIVFVDVLGKNEMTAFCSVDALSFLNSKYMQIHLY